MTEQLRPYLIFWGLGLMAFAAEYLFPARPMRYRSVFLSDLVALATYNICFALVVPITDRIPIPNYVPEALLKMSTPYKLLLFYIVEDFGLYWVHRFMHTPKLWRTHKWHHYPKLYVLACGNSNFNPAYYFVQRCLCCRKTVIGPRARVDLSAHRD